MTLPISLYAQYTQSIYLLKLNRIKIIRINVGCIDNYRVYIKYVLILAVLCVRVKLLID